MNIWQSYKQEGGCLVHFVRLTTTLLSRRKCTTQSTFFACNYAKYLPIRKVFTGTLSNKPCLIYLLKIPTAP